MDNIPKLKESLKFFDVFFVSLGYIIGAGIYSLIYLITSYGKQFTWLSFILGGFISLLTALSYSDLSEHFDSNASEYDYITIGLTKDKFKFIIAILLVGLGIFTLSTFALAFTNISKKIFNRIPYKLILFMILFVTTIINVYDLKLTTNINMGISITETVVLIVLVLLSMFYIITTKNSNIKNTTKIIDNFNLDKFDYKGIIHGAFLTILAFSGFETIPRLAEETEDSKKNIPKAMIASIGIVMIIYVLVSFSINNVLGIKNVINNVNPISETFNKLLGNKSKHFINLITLISIYNVVQLTLLFTSRQLYGISKKNVLPKIFSKVNEKTRTPINAILFTSIIAFIICFFTNIKSTCHISNGVLIFIFILVNLSATVLAYEGKINVNGLGILNENKKDNKRKGRISYYSLLGTIISLLILFYMIFN